MWIWTGIVYHGLYFSAINKAAFAFGAAFVLQGVGFAYAGFTGRLAPGLRHERSAWIGWFLVAYRSASTP